MSFTDKKCYTNALTVRQLIEKLTALPEEQKDFQVEAEGCDCDGAAVDIVVSEEHRIVKIAR